ALCAGFAACRGDIIVMLDADGSADPGEIPQFVAVLTAGYDYAKGSRFLRGGGSCDITPLRRCGNFFLSRIVNLLYQARFSDLCYGYNAFWRRCLDRVDIDCDGFEIETQINLRMLKANCKIIEVPSFEYARIYGTSNLQVWQDGWRVLRTILRERHSRLMPKRLPIVVQSPDATAPRQDRNIAVVICAFAAERWDALVRAVTSVQHQATPSDEIVVVVDHNHRLLQRVRDELPHVIAVANDGQRGLSDARNSGIAASTGEIIAFLDDDAVAGPDWLAQVGAAYDDKAVIATGGTIIPIWQGKRPAWLPEEFYWVIGCTYRGLPTTAQAVRNPIGANMSFRRQVFEAAGGF
ncbi:MAG TPA: glycosyltransferase, partial [Ktedonobacterales bacterium]|nr:glycosyltransferase [Ktedonobacterales bacterium]